MQISIVDDPQLESAYSQYVSAHPDSTIYHTLAWRDIVQREYGFRPLYLIAESDGKTVGAMPVFQVNNLTGRKLISLPCSQFGGDLSDDEKVTQEFLRYLSERQSELRFKKAVIKFNRQLTGDYEGWDVRQEAVVCTLDTTKTFDELKKAFSRNKKRTYKKGLEAGLETKWCDTDADLRAVYDLEVDLRRRQGVPIFSFRYLRDLVRVFSPDQQVRVLMTKDSNGKIVAAELFFQHKENATNGYSVTHAKQYDTISPITFTQWNQIQYCAENAKIRELHFGTTDLGEEGILLFKKKWGAEDWPISTAYFPSGATVTSTTKSGLAYRLFRSGMRRLPRGVYSTVGRYIIRGLA